MTHAAYLLCLIGALTCIGLIDWRYKLALFRDRNRTLLIVGLVVAFFVTWDIAGIALGIFAQGQTPYNLAFSIAPEFPLEEALFLTHLSYTTLVAWRFLEVRWRRT